MKKFFIAWCILLLSSCHFFVQKDISEYNKECLAAFSGNISENSPKIFWSFWDVNHKKCYYLGFSESNFFLISSGDPYTDNLLYSPFGGYEDFIWDFQSKYIHWFQETPAFHNFYDIADLYEKTFKNLNISLPKSETVPVFATPWIEEFYKNSISDIVEKAKNPDTSAVWYPILSPSRHTEFDIRNVYDMLVSSRKN